MNVREYILMVMCMLLPFGGQTMSQEKSDEMISLPGPRQNSPVSVEEALTRRRSVRTFKDKPVSLQEVAQVLWAAQGITGASGRRTAPSAGALYPLEIHVLAGRVAGLDAGIYRYFPHEHALRRTVEGDQRKALAAAALDQSWMTESPVVFVISAVYERTTWKYGERGKRYVHIEAGHAGQNILAQAVALDLGGVVVGAFDDSGVKKLLNLPEQESPLYLLPVGH